METPGSRRLPATALATITDAEMRKTSIGQPAPLASGSHRRTAVRFVMAPILSAADGVRHRLWPSAERG